MRFTNQIRPLLVGLPILVSQAFLFVAPATAWDWFGLTADEGLQQPVAKSPAAGSGPIAPTSPRWSDGQAVQQAYAQGVSRTGGVQQTSHTGPSRSGTLLGNSTAENQSNGKKPPTWHGQSLRMPTKMFARGGADGHPAPPIPAGMNYHGTAASAAQAQQRSANQSAASRSSAIPTPWPSTGAPPAAASAAGTNRTARNQTTANPSRTVAQSRSTAPTQSSATKTPKSSGPTLAAAAEPTLAEPQVAEAAPPAFEPKTPGDRILLEAHEFSARATTEDDFSRLIATCRRARASQLSPSLNDYANQLAAWSLNRRGQLKAEAGHANEAMLDFDDAVRGNPKLWRALHNRAVLRAQTGQYEQAFDDLNLTIQINPKFAKAYSNRAALFVAAGDLPSALDDYSHAIELDPNLSVAHRGRARICHQLGRLDEALDHYDAAVQLAPDDAYAVASRADLLTDLGRYSDAAKEYNHAIQLDPQSANALRGSAWLLATCPDTSIRNADLAMERAEKAMRLENKKDAISLDTLAAAQASAGDFSAAMLTMRQAIQIAPAEECDVYHDRLMLYQRAKPYRIAPVRNVEQASYEAGSMEQGAGSRSF